MKINQSECSSSGINDVGATVHAWLKPCCAPFAYRAIRVHVCQLQILCVLYYYIVFQAFKGTATMNSLYTCNTFKFTVNSHAWFTIYP